MIQKAVGLNPIVLPWECIVRLFKLDLSNNNSNNNKDNSVYV